MTKKSAKQFSVVIIIIILLSSVLYLILFPPIHKYHVDRYVSAQDQDMLLTNIVTYMGVKPRNTNYETRLDPVYRKFYAEQAKEYRFFRYFIDDSGTHYFYIIRPARHALGNRRAIGGTFKLGENLELLNYEEKFVTQVLDENFLEDIADDLFIAMINDNLDKHLENRILIEWPDSRLRYDKEKKEWRYDVTTD
jgi:hypothetical protein